MQNLSVTLDLVAINYQLNSPLRLLWLLTGLRYYTPTFTCTPSFSGVFNARILLHALWRICRSVLILPLVRESYYIARSLSLQAFDEEGTYISKGLMWKQLQLRSGCVDNYIGWLGNLFCVPNLLLFLVSLFLQAIYSASWGVTSWLDTPPWRGDHTPTSISWGHTYFIPFEESSFHCIDPVIGSLEWEVCGCGLHGACGIVSVGGAMAYPGPN